MYLWLALNGKQLECGGINAPPAHQWCIVAPHQEHDLRALGGGVRLSVAGDALNEVVQPRQAFGEALEKRKVWQPQSLEVGIPDAVSPSSRDVTLASRNHITHSYRDLYLT